MDAMPVPVHFDGHNINIITEDTPIKCKDHKKIMCMSRTTKNKKRTTKVHPRTGALSSDKPSVAGTDLRSLQSVSKSLSISPDHSIRDSSNEATDSLSPGLNGGVSYKSKTMRDTATASAVAAESTNDIETSSTSKKSSPSKKRGTNPNAKPFVMTVRSTGATAGSVTNTSSSVATHREGYQLPPRIRKRDNGSGFAPHCPTVGQVQFGHPMPQGQGQGHRISYEQLNAQGFNPAEFGSHDDQIMDDEEDHGPQTKGKDRRSLFKTELCREYSTSGWCYYNKRCSFAHGLHELRPVFRSKKWRSKRCRNWHTTGYCPYEHRCQFLHDQSPPRRLTDYAPPNASALPTPQPRMKPLYFHYQVDVGRDTTDDQEASAAHTDSKKTQRDPTPGSSRSGSGVTRSSASRLDPAKGRVSGTADIGSGTDNDCHDTASSKKKILKNPVITQFNVAAEVYQPPPPPPSNPFHYGQMQAAAAAQGVPAPYAIYQGAIPSVIPMQLPAVSAANQSLMNAMNVPLPSPALTANTFAPSNPPANVDAALYLNFTPSPTAAGYQEANANPAATAAAAAAAANVVLPGNLSVMPALALPAAQSASGGSGAAAAPFPESLTLASAGTVASKSLQNLESQYDQQVTSMYDKVYDEINRQHATAHQHQQVLHGVNLSTFGGAPSPTPDVSDSLCYFDDAALMGLLPQDANQGKAQKQGCCGDGVLCDDVEGDGHGDDDNDDEKEIEADPAAIAMDNELETKTSGNGPLSVSHHSHSHSHSHSIQSAVNMEKRSATVSGGQRDGINDDAKVEMDESLLSMAGIAPPCPPALQLQTSNDSVVMGAVDAAMVPTESPTGIDVSAQAQAQQLALAQQAHLYAQAHAASQVPGLHSYPSPFAFTAVSPDYVNGLPATAATATTPVAVPVPVPAAAAPVPYAYTIPPAVAGSQVQALRIQPPATLSSGRMSVEGQWTSDAATAGL